jgi:universal stress protein A
VPLYQRILVAVDLDADSLQVAKRARELADTLGAELNMVHVVPPMMISSSIPSEPVATDALSTVVEVTRHAQRTMLGVAHDLGLDDAHWQVAQGDIQDQIVRTARELAADLIVIGAHERHGLALLMPSTESGVARRSPCDVLEIRLAG